MGKFDSSLTRVQPVFEALYLRDASGEAWLRPLLEMARHTAGPAPMAIPADVGQLVAPPQFEFAADPPRSLLEWLIRNPGHLDRPSEADWRKWSRRTQTKRDALLSGDAAVQAEALAQLESSFRLPRRAWWRFEGITRVDCALLTPSAVVFVEGKRTEMGPSKGVTWCPHRNQVLRVLDRAAAFAQQTGRPHFFVVLVVEKDLVEREAERQREIESVVSPETIRRSLPHLADKEQTELMSYYLGVTTWQDIVERFDLRKDVLINKADC